MSFSSCGVDGITSIHFDDIGVQLELVVPETSNLWDLGLGEGTLIMSTVT